MPSHFVILPQGNLLHPVLSLLPVQDGDGETLIMTSIPRGSFD